MNKYISAAIAGVALSLTATMATAEAAKPAAPAEASIPFAANHGGILNWRADGNKGLYVQGPRRQWYYAKFIGSCLGRELREHAPPPSIRRRSGRFDRSSAVVRAPRRPLQLAEASMASDGPSVEEQRRTQGTAKKSHTGRRRRGRSAVITADQQGSSK